MAPELYTLIEDYLDGTLSDQERQAFDAEIRDNSELSRALAIVQETRKRLQAQWADEQADVALAETLRQIGSAHFQTISESGQSGRGGGRIFRLSPTWWAAAAALAATVVAAWLFLRPPSYERLYAQYGTMPEADFVVRGNAEKPDLSAAETAFNSQSFAEALRGLNAHLAQNPSDEQARVFAGLCQLELGQYDQAVSLFEQVASSTNIWAEEATWYLALTYLRQGQRDACVRTLRSIPPGSGRHEQSVELQKQLQ
ncbi:MAG: tetratricopeptide repeat protein [Saprospiraceae bacterium]